MASKGRSAQVKSLTYSKSGNRGRNNAVERRKQFTPRKRTSESEGDGTCDLCVQKIKIYAIGHCDHAICYRCSAKMRVLCEQLDCAVCRVSMKKIIYSKSYRTFNDANVLHLIHHSKHNAWFTDEVVQAEYEKLFQHRCAFCPTGHLETSFEKLEVHMRREHKLFYCNLCVRFNTNFTDECKTYTRELLARHRRVGDDDDSSHKGHPLCEFCDERYLDKDVLLQHLRKDHYFCHFCDKNGKNQYYDGYVDLRQHYREDHFLCEEGDCINEQFTSAHRSVAHKDGLSRQQQKVERNIDLGFQYAKPSRGGRGRRDDNGPTTARNGVRSDTRNGKPGRVEDLELAKAISLSEQEKGSKPSSKGKETRLRVQREQPKQEPEREPTPPPDLVADFPTLGASGNDQVSQDPYHYSSVRAIPQNPEAKPPEPIQHAGPTAANRLAAAAGLSVGKITKDDFPSLGNNEPSRSASNGLWSSVNNTTKPKNSVSKKVAKQADRSPQPWSSVNLKNQDDFPTLGGRPPPSATQPPPYVARPPPQPKKPVSIHKPQSKFTKSSVDFKNKDEFPTLGGKNAAPAQGTVWGPGVSVSTASKKKSKKPKTPLSSQEAPRLKQQPAVAKVIPVVKDDPAPQPSANVHREYDPMSHNNSVAIRIGSHKHTVRLTSTDYSAALEGVEKPVEVPGVGSNSVRTVSAEAFSMLSKSSGVPWNQRQVDQSKFDTRGGSDFPELPSGRSGKIKGISNTTSLSSQTTASKLSLSNLSKEILSKGKINVANEPSYSLLNYDDSFPSAKPPALSSYAADWYEDQHESASAMANSNESKFQTQEGDFPSLSTDIGKKYQPVGRKNKKKKKKGASVNDLSKHFGTTPVEQNTGHLETLLKSQNSDQGSSITDLLDKGKTFAQLSNKPTNNSTPEQGNGEAAKTDMEDFTNHYDGIMLAPRPHRDNIEGRNIWLINTVQQVCGTDENFTEFKISSGKFRQGLLTAGRYYEKCKMLLGKAHFELVFMELVDLLPDPEKQELLMRAHRQC